MKIPKRRRFVAVNRPAKIGEFIRVTNVVGHARFDGRYDMGDMLRVTHDDSNIVDQWVGKAVGFENITHPERPWKYCVIRHANYVVLEVCVAKASEAELEEKEMMC